MADKTKNKAVSNIKTIVVSVFLVALVLFYFQHLSNKTAERKTEEQKNELTSLCEYNMETDYPKTARDTIKLHNRYFKLFYGQKIDDDDLEVLNNKIRSLYSEELISYNPQNISFEKLKQDIEKTKKNKYTYKSYELPEASQIKYYEQNGKKMATAEVKVNVSLGKDTGYIFVQYVLVEENDNWKILAWGESKLGHDSE